MHLKPTYLFLILFLACLGVGCERNKPNDPYNYYDQSENEIKDSITYYLGEAYNNEYSVAKRKSFAWRVYAVTQKLNDSLKAGNYINISNRFSKINDHDNYLYINRKALKIATKVNDKKRTARILFNLGNYYLNKNYRSDSAYYYYKKAKKYYTELKDTLRIGMTLRNIGIIQRNENDFLGSEASTKKAISYFELAQDNLYISYSYNSLGLLSTDIEQYENAIKYYSQSLEYRREIPNRSSNILLSEVYPINNIGQVYEKQGIYKEALSYYKQALAYEHFFEELPDFYSSVLDNIAHTNFKLGNIENLPQLYFNALKISDSLNHIPVIIKTKIHLAEFYKANDNIELAKKYGYEAKTLSEKSKNKGDLLRSILMLSQIESGEKALEFTKLYIKMQDSLKKNEINTAKELFAGINHDLDEVTQKNEKITNQKGLLILLVTLLTITFTTLYFLRQKKHKKYKKKFEQILSEESQKLRSNETATPKKKDLDLDKSIVNNILSHLKEFESGTEYLQKGITIVELSKEFNTNSKYLSKVINSYKEKNFTTYINDLKINYAIKRLQHDEKFKLYTIKAIAQEIGFNNAQTFSVAFYKKTGIYPSYFINQLNKLNQVRS